MLRSAHQRFDQSGNDAANGSARQERIRHYDRDLVPEGAGIDTAGAHHLFRALSAARTPDGLAKIVLGTVADTTGAHRVLALAGEGGAADRSSCLRERQDDERRWAMDGGAI